MSSTSKIIIGCMGWGKWGKQLSTKEQANLIEFCLENGNNTFDHADIYGDYTTEMGFGKALIESKINRKDFKIISKCGIQYVGESRKNTVKHYNYSKEYIIWSAEESLKKLKTEYLDTFLLHRPSPLMNPTEISEAISELKKSGKIINFGVSNFTPSQVSLIANKTSIAVNQIEFSLTQNSAMTNGSLDQMMVTKIKPMCWKPLGNIFKEETAQTIRVKKVLKTLSKKYNITENALLLAWILKHPSNISPVIGTTNKNRILQANKALKTTLALEDWFVLLEASLGHKVA